MIRLEDVHVTFNTGTVNEVRASAGHLADAGRWRAGDVVGSNGAGKSTLLNTMAGRGLSASGRVQIGDVDVTEMVEHQRARHVGRVFQNPLDGTAAGNDGRAELALAARRGHDAVSGRLWASRERREFRDLLAEIGLGLERRLKRLAGLLSAASARR